MDRKPMNHPSSRRDWMLQVGALGAIPGTLACASAATREAPSQPAVRYSLNTATVRGQKRPLAELVELTAKAGYDAIEPWIGEIETHKNQGGNLKDLGKKIADLGLIVPSAIGFAEWVVDDPDRRKKGLEQARRDMDLVKQIGGTRIAAPPAGATNKGGLDLGAAAERYAALLKVGKEIGITAQLEMWGFSKNLSRTYEVTQVALNSNDPTACILADIYHIFKGGSSLETVHLLGPQALQVFHMNDYPGNFTREKINDADRVYPGDGICPLGEVLGALFKGGFKGVLSLELFNPNYYKQDPFEVMKTGLEKLKQSVAKAA